MISEPGGSHMNVEDLALLAEGRMGQPASLALHDHLSKCRSCMAAYAEAVRYRAAWLAAPEAFRPSRALVDAGLQIPSNRKVGPRDPVAQASRPRRHDRRTRWMVASAGLAACLAAALALGPARFGLRAGAGALPPPIRAALETSSARGLVLPRGEAGAVAERPVYRSGGAVSLSEEVTRAIQAYERGRRTPAQTYTVGAGLLVSGQLDAARDYVEEGLRRYPRDARLLVLAADIAYRTSELGQAEVSLRTALRSRPGDATIVLDLAIVLAERGRREEAERLLRQVAERHARTPVGARARQELVKLDR
ncbi:MAG TPA: tetratricopeptide repeat protein [Candidatus Eisenbacteria bacterium]|jgi:tetratricopeptide (TPR) repeat protein